MVFFIYIYTDLLGYYRIFIDGWEERDVEGGKGGAVYKVKK